jgi:hypothetical protein
MSPFVSVPTFKRPFYTVMNLTSEGSVRSERIQTFARHIVIFAPRQECDRNTHVMPIPMSTTNWASVATGKRARALSWDG